MSSPKPTFRVMKNGYDRFAVDDSIDKDVQKIKSQEDMRKLIIYQFKKSLFGGPLPEDFDHM